VAGVEFKKCISAFDKNGKFNPQFDEQETCLVEADFVLVSIGQAMDWGALLDHSTVELNANKTLKADPLTYQTGQPDVFVGGDAYTGPKFAIDAIAAGKQAAISIHRFVHPGQSLTIGRSKREYLAFDKTDLYLGGYDRLPRQKTAHAVGAKSKVSFSDLRTTFTEDQVKQETARCLSCGATFVDEALCVGCGVCTTKCKFDAISLVRVYDGVGAALPDMKPIVIKHMLKRKVKIAAKKVTRSIQSILKS
jgi:ferredoxin